MQRAEWNA